MTSCSRSPPGGYAGLDAIITRRSARPTAIVLRGTWRRCGLEPAKALTPSSLRGERSRRPVLPLLLEGVALNRLFNLPGRIHPNVRGIDWGVVEDVERLRRLAGFIGPAIGVLNAYAAAKRTMGSSSPARTV